jgi:hypothetical protein
VRGSGHHHHYDHYDRSSDDDHYRAAHESHSVAPAGHERGRLLARPAVPAERRPLLRLPHPPVRGTQPPPLSFFLGLFPGWSTED